MTVGELLQRVTSAELSEWMAYFKLQNEAPEKPKAADVIKAQFANRVQRKD
jgi:hypothetical protein